MNPFRNQTCCSPIRASHFILPLHVSASGCSIPGTLFCLSSSVRRFIVLPSSYFPCSFKLSLILLLLALSCYLHALCVVLFLFLSNSNLIWFAKWLHLSSEILLFTRRPQYNYSQARFFPTFVNTTVWLRLLASAICPPRRAILEPTALIESASLKCPDKIS